MRLAFAVTMIVSQLAIGTYDCWRGDWRTGCCGFLFAAANSVIFLVR